MIPLKRLYIYLSIILLLPLCCTFYNYTINNNLVILFAGGLGISMCYKIEALYPKNTFIIYYFFSFLFIMIKAVTPFIYHQ